MNEPSFYRVSVKALVRDSSGRILISRELDGRWDLLGGGLDHEEDPIDGLRRELYEESGLVAAKIASHPSYFLTMYNPKHQVHIANVIYEAELANLDFTPSDECLELRFVSFDEIADLDVQPNIRKLFTLLRNSNS